MTLFYRLTIAGLVIVLAFALATPGESQRQVPQSREQVKLSYAPIVREAAPAVVNVYARRIVRSERRRMFADPTFDRLFGDFFGAPRERVQNSLGSGVIVRDNGVIVTNAHVVDGAQELRVVLNDRREYDAELVLSDTRTDLALLRIDAGSERLPFLAMDLSGETEVGDLVLAIGNPFGVGQTVTSGIVSALGRSDVGVTDFSFFIQTDAAVNPGNSGGALVDLDGELIGVNTAIFSRSGGSNGIGFAIPVDLVQRFVEDALSNGQVSRPWFGARGQTVTPDIALGLGLDRPQGFVISDIYPDGPADRAGLRPGDVVLSLDGVEVNDEAALRFRLATRRLGERAAIRVFRDGRAREVSLAVQSPPDRPAPDERELGGVNPLAGATVVNLSPAFNDERQIDVFLRGVAILSVTRASPADYYGFRPGDVIVEVEGTSIDTTAELQRLLSRADGARQWQVTVQRGGRNYARTIRF